MTKKDLMKAMRGMPDNAEIVLVNTKDDFFHKATAVCVEKRARIKKIVLVTNSFSLIQKDRLLLESKVVYAENMED